MNNYILLIMVSLLFVGCGPSLVEFKGEYLKLAQACGDDECCLASVDVIA